MRCLNYFSSCESKPDVQGLLTSGCLLSTFSLMMLSLSSQYYQIFLSQGIGLGLGIALQCVHPTPPVAEYLSHELISMSFSLPSRHQILPSGMLLDSRCCTSSVGLTFSHVPRTHYSSSSPHIGSASIEPSHLGSSSQGLVWEGLFSQSCSHASSHISVSRGL